jgi:hypothetical protein
VEAEVGVGVEDTCDIARGPSQASREDTLNIVENRLSNLNLIRYCSIAIVRSMRVARMEVMVRDRIALVFSLSRLARVIVPRFVEGWRSSPPVQLEVQGRGVFLDHPVQDPTLAILAQASRCVQGRRVSFKLLYPLHCSTVSRLLVWDKQDRAHILSSLVRELEEGGVHSRPVVEVHLETALLGPMVLLTRSIRSGDLSHGRLG